MGLDGKFQKTVAELRPPGRPTGHSHPHCYLKATCNCSEQITREHYISESVLKQLGSILRVSGAPFLAEDVVAKIAITSLTAKILCKRHNEALSPLDTEAAIFFKSLFQAWHELARKKSLSRKRTFHLASGEALELWMLKVACGIYYSVASKAGVKLLDTHSIDMDRVNQAFFDRKWDDHGGLYLSGGTLTTTHAIEVAPLSDEDRKRFNGIRLSLLGLKLGLLFDARNSNPGRWTALARRPTELLIKSGKRAHHLVLTWPVGAPELSVTIERSSSIR